MINADPLSIYIGGQLCREDSSSAPPVFEKVDSGQSVEYCSNWYVIRATMGRARKVAEQLRNRGYDVFLPIRKVRTEVVRKGVGTVLEARDEIVSKSLLFVHCSSQDMDFLVRESGIAGLTPYYNHFEREKSGRDKYLIVPDRQMKSFVNILNSENNNVLIRLDEPLRVTEGQKVRVMNGEFEGVEGVVMRISGQRRVVVELKGIGFVATAFVPNAFLELI